MTSTYIDKQFYFTEIARNISVFKLLDPSVKFDPADTISYFLKYHLLWFP